LLISSTGQAAAALLLLATLPCRANLAALAALDGASGYEGAVRDYVARAVQGRQEVDNTGSLSASFGSGRPHTLLIAGLDEPGYVVSAISEDGYLRLQRLSAAPPHYNFESFFLAQPVRITTAAGKTVSGVVAVPSVHLQPERGVTPRLDQPEQFYVDIGARSLRQAREAGVDLLDPITLEKHYFELGTAGRASAPWISSRAGASVLIDLARRLPAGPLEGEVTLAFVSQQYSGHRGLARLARRVDADRIVWLKPGGGAQPSIAPASDDHPQMADALLALASKRKFDLERETASRLVLPAYMQEEIWKHPARVAILSLGVENAGTPVEVVSRSALEKYAELLAALVGSSARPSAGPLSSRASEAVSPSTLQALVEVYGVSGREDPVRRAIERLLPEWAQRKTRVDPAGNLIVELGTRPETVFIAHMDELGFEIKTVESDGRLLAETRGGGTAEFFEWRPGMVHTRSRSLPAILLGGGSYRLQVDMGASSAAEVAALGVQAGDTITVRKKLRHLLGGRVNARSIDDRIGCAVLVDVLRTLKPEEIRRPVWFVFSVEEEVGLRGAEFLAASVSPRQVFPIDTFTSSDSPLENPRMAGARLGEGFVIRAIDSAGIAPRAAVGEVMELARRHQIRVQYGVTSGLNDGAKFLTGGAVNLPLGWPLRYSHSPAEVADLADVEALRRIVRALVVN